MNFSKFTAAIVAACLCTAGAQAASPGTAAQAGIPQGGATLAAIREAGHLTCGAVIDEDDYSEADTHGDLSALGAQYCRALAAEVLGDPAKAMFLASSDEPTALAALRDGKTDVLFGATPNPVIGNVYGVGFGPPIFYDGTGFLVTKESGITKIADMAKRRVCFINAAPPEKMVYDVLERQLPEPETRYPFSERGEMEVALLDGHCDAMIGDISWMANVRASMHAKVSNFTVLPVTLSIEPLSPVYRRDDPQFAALVDWTVWVLLQAEEHGVTQANAEAMRKSADPVAQRLTGGMPWIAKAFGLGDDAFLHAILAVGNYGEIYDHTVGMQSRLQLPRGRNALATNGGLMWALPIEQLQ